MFLNPEGLLSIIWIQQFCLLPALFSFQVLLQRKLPFSLRKYLMNVKDFLTLRKENSLRNSVYFMLLYIKEGCMNKHAVQ